MKTIYLIMYDNGEAHEFNEVKPHGKAFETRDDAEEYIKTLGYTKYRLGKYYSNNDFWEEACMFITEIKLYEENDTNAIT